MDIKVSLSLSLLKLSRLIVEMYARRHGTLPLAINWFCSLVNDFSVFSMTYYPIGGNVGCNLSLNVVVVIPPPGVQDDLLVWFVLGILSLERNPVS